MLKNPSDFSSVKIVDFGLSAYLHDDELRGRVGTLPYMAPE